MASDALEQDKACPVDHAAIRQIDMPLEEMSLTDPLISAYPDSYYTKMRSDDPIHYDEKLKMYLISRFEDIQTIQRDPITYSVKHGYEEQYAKGYAAEFKEILERDGGGFFPDAIMSDPPYHTRIRKLMEKAFSAHRVKALEPGIEKIIVDVIEGIADKGRCDAIDDFAVPITINVICEQLGLDFYDAKNIQRWSHAVTQQIGRMQSREQMQEHAREICGLQNYLIARMREREDAPSEDMISDIVHAELDDGTRLTFEEAVSLIRALLIAGNETTATAMGNLIFILATQPEVARLLHDAVDDDRLLGRFVEELLRFKAPVRGLSRMTTKAVEIGGKTLPEGAHLLLMYASANHDDKEFACPGRFDMERRNLGRQVAFGGGPHRCVGLALARMEIKVAAREVVKRLADIRLAIDPGEIEYLPTVATHSIAKLPIIFARR